MKNYHICSIACLLTFFLVLLSAGFTEAHAEVVNLQVLPAPKYEVRAVWLTTIGGLDWPKKTVSSASDIEAQKAELIDILDRMKAANFNTVFLQTRIRGTVIYPSAIEPWDGCLTGHPGKHPGYDPLQFAIDACHERGLELHAWVVAFPGHNFSVASALGAKAMNKRIPKLCIKTDKFWMLNPGEPQTASYVASICSEIVRNYNVDGIHLDYIRYPESSVRFSDAATYRKLGGKSSLRQWRRNNVTNCVRAVHGAVKSLKPWVRMSCSPIGKYDDTDRYSSHGWNAYEIGCQDAQGWLREGIMDMLVPMMYFKGDQFFPFAYDWKDNSCGRIVVPGLGPYLMRERGWSLQTVTQEVSVLRLSDFEGQAYFRAQHTLKNDDGLYDFLKKKAYAYPAFTPPLTWDCKKQPSAPVEMQVKEMIDGISLMWDDSDDDTTIFYNVYASSHYPVDVTRIENMVEKGIRGKSLHLKRILPSGWGPYYVVTAMNRYGVESEPSAFNRPEMPVSLPVEYMGNIHVADGDLFVDEPIRFPYIILEDETGRIVQTVKAQQKLPLGSLQRGVYTVRTLEQHGRSRCLGKFEWGF